MKRSHPDLHRAEDRALQSIRRPGAETEPAVAQFDRWMQSIEARHLADLQFPEVTRALRALSSAYVERRTRLRAGVALDGAGKRAAFALFYGPLHFLLVRSIAASLPGGRTPMGTLVDLGCGTGAAGAGWAAACSTPPRLLGVDRHPWAVTEAVHTYRTLGLRGLARTSDLSRDPLPDGGAYLAAFALNELAEDVRDRLLATLLARGVHGRAVLVVEPLAKSAAPWWRRASGPFLEAGGRADEWRFTVTLPAIVSKLDRAAGLDHREITGRSLWIGGRR